MAIVEKLIWIPVEGLRAGEVWINKSLSTSKWETAGGSYSRHSGFGGLGECQEDGILWHWIPASIFLDGFSRLSTGGGLAPQAVDVSEAGLRGRVRGRGSRRISWKPWVPVGQARRSGAPQE